MPGVASKTFRRAAAALVFLWVLPAMAIEIDAHPELLRLVEEMQAKQGWGERTKKILQEARIDASVLALTRKGHAKKGWERYLARVANSSRTANASNFCKKEGQLFSRIEKRFSVPREVITAIAAVESDLGETTDTTRVLDALLTLALEGPDLRRDFFYQELKEWLYLSDEAGLDPVSTRGSYAGAMGMAQFMPGSWRKYGVDFDGDGKAYPFSTADALAAIAHFLQEHGFRFGEAIAEEARAVGEEPPKPEDFPIAPTLTKAALKEKGLVSASGAPLSADGALATGVILEGERPHYFLVYQNFYAITRYNRSFFYAMGVTELSRRLDCARGDG